MFQREEVGRIADIPILKYSIFDEVATRRLITEDELVGMALIKCQTNHYRLPVRFYYDPRAPGLGLAAQQVGLSTYTCNVKVEDGIRVIRRLLERELIGFHPRCKLLANNFVTYNRDDKGFPVDRHNDALDALRYGISMSEKLDGRWNSVMAENRELVEQMGVETSSVLSLRL